MENTVRVAVYVRVSTQDQSCEMQREELLAFAESRGWEIFSVYEDQASGCNSNRPMLKQMLKDSRLRNFDILICWKLDRLFRSLKDLVVTIQDLNELGVSFVSLRDNIDLTTAAGRLMLHLLGAFGEFEASLIRSRVIAGLAHAKSKGTCLGRPKRLDPKQIFALKQHGLSLRQIAVQVGCTKSAVSKTLKKMRAQVSESTRSTIGAKCGFQN